MPLKVNPGLVVKVLCWQLISSSKTEVFGGLYWPLQCDDDALGHQEEGDYFSFSSDNIIQKKVHH